LLAKVDVENAQSARAKVAEEIQNRLARGRRALDKLRPPGARGLTSHRFARENPKLLLLQFGTPAGRLA
jgi:hypothetical protein